MWAWFCATKHQVWFYCSFTFLLCLNFTSLFYVNVYVLYELFFSSIVLCVCFLCNHVRFSCVFCNKLTYLLVNAQRHVGGFTQETNNFAVIRWSVRCSGTNDSWEERQFGTTGLKFDTSFIAWDCMDCQSVCLSVTRVAYRLDVLSKWLNNATAS